tara:strand:- start:16 stop:168 length:153 start_codon:yes stop_codon:yes gene_type:complete
MNFNIDNKKSLTVCFIALGLFVGSNVPLSSSRGDEDDENNNGSVAKKVRS